MTEMKSANIDDQLLKELYPNYSNKEIAEKTGWNVWTIRAHAKSLKIKKTKAAKARAQGKTVWTVEMDNFLKDNFFKMTNQALADHLGLRLTITRMRTRELGLKNYDLEFWTEEQRDFLIANYKVLGDTEIADLLQQRWPRKKVWTRKHVKKKRDYLQIFRTKDEVSAIVTRHSNVGGRSYTIRENSASVNLPDNYIARCIVGKNGNKEMILEYPELIDLKRGQLQLARQIKISKDGSGC